MRGILYACGVSLLAITAFAQQQGFEGLLVQEIVFVPADQPLTAEDLSRLVTFKVGAPFHQADAASTIDGLFSTLRYTDAQIEVQPRQDGVTVRIITENQFFTGHIEVDGNVSRSPTPTELIDATRLRLGEPLYQDDLERAEQNLHRLLNNNGLYEHSIQVETRDQTGLQQRDIRFIVETGPRARYSAPTITGNPKLDSGKIIGATGWRFRFIHFWRKVRQQRTNRGIVGLLRKYQSEGLLSAEVSASRPEYDPATRRIHSTLDIEAGPLVEVQALEAKVSQKTLKRYVPVFQELAVDRDLLVAGATNLRDYFQSQGYFDADVTFRQREPDPDHLLIEYVVSLGKRYTLKHIEIQGNQFFSTENLRERMFVQESGLLRLRHGRYSETFAARDRESIANLYKANGFREIKVTSSLQENFNNKSQDVAVTINVEEGPIWLVRNLKFTGFTNIDPMELIPTLSSIEGQPFSELNVAVDRGTIVTRYQAAGFPDAAFQWTSTFIEDSHEVDLDYRVIEGRRQSVRDVTLTGIETTKLDLVTKHVTLKPGDPLSLVEMSRIQQNLYQLGVFGRIDMAIQNQAGSTPSKHVLYDFHEASRYSLAVGAGGEFARIGGTTSDLSRPEGAAGVAPRLSVDLSRLNFLGMGHSISLRGRISTLEQLASINYLAPRFRDVEGRNVTFTTQYQVQRDVRTFSSRREEAAIQVSQQLSKPSSLLLRFAYRRVSANSIVIPRLLIPQLLQPIRIGLFSGNFVQDRRDNPANATRGIYSTIDFGVASHLFGSQRSFFRTLGRNSTYYSLKKNVVLARETAVGVIFPFRIEPGLDRADAIPLPERFFGGGSATHRGFAENQAGPRDTGISGGVQVAQATGFPLGGNALFFNKVELRFPLLGENIDGVLFHDAGNIYDGVGSISFRTKQRNEADFNYMVHAAGFGVRYRTPVGPIRFDLAYSINPPRYQGFEGSTQEFLNCGPAGSPTECQSVSRRASHLQFFFSIGQTF